MDGIVPAPRVPIARRSSGQQCDMVGDGDLTYLLRGGGRDGEVTTVSDGLTRLYAVSDAPGLVDVYERTEEIVEHHPEADGPVGVFEFTGQETTEGLAPELQHMQGPNPVPGDS
jgi:hypothetical protein